MESTDSRIHYSGDSKYREIGKVWKGDKKCSGSSNGNSAKKGTKQTARFVESLHWSNIRGKEAPTNIMLLLTNEFQFGQQPVEM